MSNLFKVEGRIDLPKLIISIIIPQGIGLLSAFFTAGMMDRYKDLAQPWFAPPGWVFGPVWTVLFFLMGIASYRVWISRKRPGKIRSALGIYGVHLVFNFLWSIIFFRWELRGLAFFELIVLLVLIIITTKRFYRINRVAGDLMIPYIAWVAFAGVLNYSVWMLNR